MIKNSMPIIYIYIYIYRHAYKRWLNANYAVVLFCFLLFWGRYPLASLQKEEPRDQQLQKIQSSKEPKQDGPISG